MRKPKSSSALQHRLGDLVVDLYRIHLRLKGLAYLLSRESPSEAPANPEEIVEIREGIGAILEALDRELREITRALDELAVKKFV